MPSLPKIFGSPGIIILSFIILFLAVYFIYSFYNSEEGFSTYPVNNKRIQYEETAKRRYNEYADTIDVLRPNIIPNGPNGDPLLRKLLLTPAVEGKDDSLTMSGLTYNDKFKYLSPEVDGEILARIKRCEAVKSWNCSAFDNPDFLQYCGICTEGINHLGEKHIGGLYIDPEIKQIETESALAKGKKPKLNATAGSCSGELLSGRPYCDIQKDRYECSKTTGFDGEAAKTKCSLCAFDPTGSLFVYTGNRKPDYALLDNKTPFPIRLRLALANTTEVSIRVTRKSDSKVFNGSFIANTNVFIADIPGCKENDTYRITVSYPEYDPYSWSKEDVARLGSLIKPASASLVRATYGPYKENFMQDDPRSVDVSNYLRNNFKMTDCSKTEVAINNDSMGGDPAPGVQKQLRIVYSENGTDFAYSYGVEGDKTKPMKTESLNALCPEPIPRSEAERAVCETDKDGNLIEGRIYTQGRNQSYPGVEKTNSVCIVERIGEQYAIAGVIESTGRALRQIPLDIVTAKIDGYEIGKEGVKTQGTLKGSKKFKSIGMSRFQGLPPSLFWFWSKKPGNRKIEIDFIVSATLKDPTISDDIILCPNGPLITTLEASRRLNYGACEKMIDGKPQEPGTYSDDCLRSLFLASGCSKLGKAYPENPKKAEILAKDPVSNKYYNSDEIIDATNEIYTIATTGSTSAGVKVEDGTLEKTSLDCFGIIMKDPCETAFKETGPHTVACLDYLFKDAGRMNANIGATYLNVDSRSSGTGRTDKTPIMYCQRNGTLSPIGGNGVVNTDAVKTANSYGSLRAVKEFYRQVHYDANYNNEPLKQKIALEQCYGVGVNNEKPICKGTKGRYVRVRPAMKPNNNIQISQLEVYDVNNKLISLNKPTKGSKSIAGAPSTAVNGKSSLRTFPDLYVSENDTTVSKSEMFWEVDLGQTEDISYVVYKNAGLGLPRERSIGMRIQVVDDNDSVIREETLKGGEVETVMFSNAKQSEIFKPGSNITFIPGNYTGSSISVVAGGELLIQPINSSTPTSRLFTVVPPNSSSRNSYSFKAANSDKYLRVQGFRLRLASDDGSNAFKKETTFSVVDSNAGNPGEVSYESVSTPGAFLAVSQNMGVYVSKVTDQTQKKASSWRIKVE
jgi:hypothetical protein